VVRASGQELPMPPRSVEVTEDAREGRRASRRGWSSTKRTSTFTKTLDWQSEHEYRVTLFPGKTFDDGYVYVPFGGAESVRAVILGEHFPQSQVPKAESICQQAGVELLIAIWASRAPRLL
jgi:hypothetical protein